MMAILVKSDDVRRGGNAKARQGSSRAVTGGTGINGLTKNPKIQIFQNFYCFWPQFRQIFQIYHKRTHLLENWVT